MERRICLNLFSVFFLLSTFAGAQRYCWQSSPGDSANALCNRIAVPEGYVRPASPEGSFARWLQHLPLKPGRGTVYFYNGVEKPNQRVHHAVIDIDTGKRNLQQCADAVMRLRAEYLFAGKQYEDIHFNFTNGERVNYSDWARGLRPIVKENRVVWMTSGQQDTTYTQFRKYLTQIFIYAGTASLSGEMQAVADISEMQIGDVFIQGGFPGHAVMVVDMARHPVSGKRVFLLAQSYMPAQSMHVLINPGDPQHSPWYPLDFPGELVTPEWTFQKSDLKRFPK